MVTGVVVGLGGRTADIGLGGKTMRSTSAVKTVATTFGMGARDPICSGGGKIAPTAACRSEDEVSFVYALAIQTRVIESVWLGLRSYRFASKVGAEASR